VTRPDLEVVGQWVARWCAVQGVEVKVTDGEAAGRVAALLREGRRPHRIGPPTGDPVTPPGGMGA